jgi:hypothetical protein
MVSDLYVIVPAALLVCFLLYHYIFCPVYTKSIVGERVLKYGRRKEYRMVFRPWLLK